MKSLIPIILIIVFLFACSDIITDPQSEIDPNLVGSWYYKISDIPIDGPKEKVYGMRIQSDGLVTKQYVHTATGILKDVEEIGRIIKTKNNQIILSQSYENLQEGKVEYSILMNYEIIDDYLYFSKDTVDLSVLPVNSFYTRTTLTEKLTEPIESYFKLNKSDSYGNNYTFTNRQIYPSPSAYSYIKENKLVIVAFSSKDYFTFEINNFYGIGTYSKENVDVTYDYVYNDTVEHFAAENSQIEVNLLVNTYEENNKVVGELELKIRANNQDITFSNGCFDVPIF